MTPIRSPITHIGRGPGGKYRRFTLLGLLKFTAIVAVAFNVAFALLPPLWALASETDLAKRVLSGLIIFPLLFGGLVITGLAFRLLTLWVPPRDEPLDEAK